MGTVSQPHSMSLLDALAQAVQAVREVRPVAARTDIAAIASDLEARVCGHWGTDHGITATEMTATARDVKASAATSLMG